VAEGWRIWTGHVSCLDR